METTYNTWFTRSFYVAFVLMSIYYLFTKNFLDVASTMGIALVFDPFNQNQSWNERPRWQKAWLFIHLAIVALAFGYGIGINEKA